MRRNLLLVVVVLLAAVGVAFLVRWRERELRADAFLTFSLGPDGAIEQAKMRAVSPATDFSFDFQDLLLVPVRTR